MKNICLLDPGYENNNGRLSSNLGDLIIQESILRELNHIFMNPNINTISTHDFPSWSLYGTTHKSAFSFVGGTNLLSSYMNEYRQWKIRFRDLPIIGRVILMGVGWWQYQDEPDLYTKSLLKSVLSKKYYHSVRDEYTAEKLRAIGITNVINTGCPTMWGLNDNSSIPVHKADYVLTTLTDYNKNPELDLKLLNTLKANYNKIFFWPQGRFDADYIKELGVAVEMLDHSFESFAQFLDSDINFDYIGTRLHGGVRCLIRSRRSLIIAIDNRAREIASDTNLPIVDRTDFDAIEHWINASNKTKIKLNHDRISQWKGQFV